jgi:hypothetical protein
VQELLQTFVAPQRKGKHELSAGVTHVPLPSQVAPGVNVVVASGQTEALHAVPWVYFWQAPAWHLPLRPQLVAPSSAHLPAGSCDPVGTLVQVPSIPGSAHDWQAPSQALSQQTPWAQKLERHSVPVEHEAPGIFLPHEFALQTFGARQFASAVQAPKHELPLHAYGLHGSESGATHFPVELQVDGGL